jgi:hypothetical protein
MYTNRKKGGGAGWQGDFVEELAREKGRSGRISHGMTRKNTETAKAKTRKKSRKEAEEFATDEHGKTRKQQKQRHGKKAGKAEELATE